MTKTATNGAREKIFKKPMLLHITFYEQFNKTKTKKIRRANSSNSSVPVKKKSP